MVPLIRPGRRVALRGAHPRELALGDPVAYRLADGSLCLHRLIGRQGDALLLRGDASVRSDPPVAPDRVLGTVEGLVVGPWQWRTAPRAVQRAGRRAWLALLPAVRLARRVRARVRQRR
ncbi:MAG: hypothetical protein ACODAU_12490 [Myxococcota bacterium]